MGHNIKRFSIILIPLLFLTLTLSFRFFKNQPSSADKTVPDFYITLNNTDLSTIENGSKNTKYSGNLLTINDGLTTASYNNVEIKGHGNSTWTEPKKPFQIKFDQKISLLNLAESKKYVLLADAFDSTHLKNTIAYKLGEMLGMPFNLHGTHVNLYIDDTYYGLYFLTEKVEINKTHIDLKDPLGIIVEHEGLHAHLEPECYQTTTSSCLIIKDTKNENLKSEAINSFLAKYIELETAVTNYDYDKIQELIDIDSFAKYYLLSDFTMNPDAFMSSYFFYQDGPNDTIHVGPGWDFDLAFYGTNQYLNYGINLFSPYNTSVNQIFHTKQSPTQIEKRAGIGEHGESESLIMYYLIHIPEFQSYVKEIYLSRLYGRSIELFEFIDNRISIIHDSAMLNNEKWNLKDFDQTSNNLKDWIRARYDYLDSHYSDRSEIPEDQIVEI